MAMLTQRQIEQIADKFGKRMEKIAQQYLAAMGEHIRDIGRLLPSDAQKLVEMKHMGVNVDAIRREIAAALEAAERDVERVFRETAETDYRAERALYEEARDVPLAKNAALMRTLKAYTRQTAEALANLSNTTVVSSAYREAVDRAVQAAQSGVTDYASAVRQALREAAACGLRVQYASGATRRLDSAVRMNVLDGVRQLNQDIAMQTGKEYGADGVELSAHALCAEDHLPYQGEQFSFKEFERLQAQLERPIGMWNCRHFAFPIILGVSEPANSKELLENYRRTSREKITIDGVTKTRYEWTQQQRKLETAVRRQKDIANTAKAAGDDVLRREAQYNIERYQAAYDRITDKAMLMPDKSRMQVSGFSSVKTIEQLKGTPKYAILKTQQNRVWLKRGYDSAVERGDISALTSFEHYMKVAEDVERNLVGLITKDRIEIVGYKPHFIDRIIGSYEKKREPVNITDIKNALLSPTHIKTKRPEGKPPSNIYVTEACKVTVNPNTGVLIQTTPQEKAK